MKLSTSEAFDIVQEVLSSDANVRKIIDRFSERKCLANFNPETNVHIIFMYEFPPTKPTKLSPQ